jgi:hypothetical protein
MKIVHKEPLTSKDKVVLWDALEYALDNYADDEEFYTDSDVMALRNAINKLKSQKIL